MGEIIEGPYEVIRYWDGAPPTQPHLLIGPKIELCFKEWVDAEILADNLNIAYAQGQASKEAEVEKVADNRDEWKAHVEHERQTLVTQTQELMKANDWWEKLRSHLMYVNAGELPTRAEMIEMMSRIELEKP